MFFFFLVEWKHKQNYRKEVENIGNITGHQRNFPTPEENPAHAGQDLSRNGTRQGGRVMAHRSTVKPKTDKKVFTNTAKKTKKINVNPKPSRGGIRL